MKKQRIFEGVIFFILFAGTIFLANWLITNVGVQHDEVGPHLIPIGFGLLAPSGVLAIGLGFTFRDLVQRRLGVKWAAVAIIIGAILSALIDPFLALASGTAFFVSEMLDLMVYTPISKKNLTAAVLASNTVGLIVDSAVFLFVAFGSLAFIQGQIVGKFYMTLLALPAIWLIRRWDEKRGMEIMT